MNTRYTVRRGISEAGDRKDGLIELGWSEN